MEKKPSILESQQVKELFEELDKGDWWICSLPASDIKLRIQATTWDKARRKAAHAFIEEYGRLESITTWYTLFKAHLEVPLNESKTYYSRESELQVQSLFRLNPPKRKEEQDV